MTADEVIKLLLTEIDKCGNQNKWAIAHGLNRGHVSLVLRSKIPIGPALLKALGLKKVISYEKV